MAEFDLLIEFENEVDQPHLKRFAIAQVNRGLKP